jgi:hypothetical protein
MGIRETHLRIMPVINVELAWDTNAPKILRDEGTCGMVNVRRELPTERNGIGSKIPATPFKTKERLARFS